MIHPNYDVRVDAKTEESADFTLGVFLSRVNEKHSKYVFVKLVGFQTDVHICACMN